MVFIISSHTDDDLGGIAHSREKDGTAASLSAVEVRCTYLCLWPLPEVVTVVA